MTTARGAVAIIDQRRAERLAEERRAKRMAQDSAALMERPMNLKRVDKAQKALTLEVRKTHKRRQTEARFAAKRAWNSGRILESRAA